MGGEADGSVSRHTYLSSTSWNRQFGVCVVVKILFSGGILGAERIEFYIGFCF